MTEDDIIYSITVPGVPESLTVLEGLCETFITEGPKCSAEMALILRLSVAEAVRNALDQPPALGRIALVTLTFVRDDPEEEGSPGFSLQIKDSGAGLALRGFLPPYPAHLIGKRVPLTQILDQEVEAEVETPLLVRLRSYERPVDLEQQSREDLIAGVGVSGLGFLALCRCWENVVFEHDPGTGTILRLSHPRPTD